MAAIKIEAIVFYSEQQGEGEVCTKCIEPIFGKMYQPHVQHGEAIDLNFSTLDLRLCQPCYTSLPIQKQ